MYSYNHNICLVQNFPGEAKLKIGDTLKILFTDCLEVQLPSKDIMFVCHPNLSRVLKKNSLVSIDDGNILLSVKNLGM